MALVGSLVVSLSAQTQPFQQGMQNATLTIKGLQSATVAAQGSISGLGTELSKFTAGLVTLQKLKDAFVSLVQAGRELELLKGTLGAVFGGSEQGQAAFQRVSAQADRLGVSVTSLAEAYRGFSAAAAGSNLEGARAEKVFQQITTAGRTMGLSTDNLQSVLLAFQQIISKGTVTAEELRGQIGERWPGAMRTAAQAMGVTEAALNKMMQRGELLADSFIVKFGDAVEKQWAGKGREIFESFDAMLNRLNNSWKQLGDTMMTGGIGDALKKIVMALDMIIKFTERGVKGIGFALGDTFKTEPESLVKWAETLYAGAGELPLVKRMKEADDALAGILKKQHELTAEIEKMDRTRPEGKAKSSLVVRREKELADLQAQADKLKQQLDEDKATFEKFAETAKNAGKIDPKTLAVEDFEKIMQRVRTLWADTMERLKEDPENAGKIWREYQNELQKLLPILDAMKSKLGDITAIQGQEKLSFMKADEQKRFAEYAPLIQSAARGARIDPNLMLAMAHVESRFNQEAVSKKGAIGLMQIMPKTGAALGFTRTDLEDVNKNIAASVKLIMELNERFGGDIEKIIQAYNAGPNQAKWSNKETRNYLQQVLAIKAALDRVQLAEVDPMVAKSRQAVNEMRDFAKAQITTIGDFDAYLRQLGKSIESYYERILSPEDFEQHSQKIRRSIEDTQTYFRKMFATDPQKAQAQVQEMMSAFQGLRLDVETQSAVAEMQEKLSQSIDDMIVKLEEEARQLTKNQDAWREYLLEVGKATPAQRQRYEKVTGEMLDYQTQKAVEGLKTNQQRDIDATIQGLEAERAQLTMTSRAYLEYQLAAKNAEDTDAARTLELYDQVAALKRVEEVSSFLTNTFEELLFNADLTFKEIALSFGRMILRMMMDAGNTQQNLGNLLMKGVNAALNIVSGVGGGVAPTSGILPTTEAAYTTMAAAGAFSGGPLPRAAGGPVVPGRFYRVGEAGPEFFSPAASGMIFPATNVPTGDLPHMPLPVLGSASASGSAGRPLTPITMHVHTANAESFTRSRGEVENTLVAAMQRAQRNA